MYFRDIEKWTTDPRQAATFLRSTSALQFVAEEQLQGVEVVFAFKDPRYNIHFPAQDQTPRPNRL